MNILLMISTCPDFRPNGRRVCVAKLYLYGGSLWCWWWWIILLIALLDVEWALKYIIIIMLLFYCIQYGYICI